ncbi:hypothetical protein CQA49_09195 [Helicobacter sp. MIT 00-7814]|uniref:hypothetical protein n=1 Tax=unclassified Helicobacter TaxID=2593540 RepID=UPI000E1FA948|nr:MULTISPECIES: hypothetical protein [unclassified Helicobacter]RDU51760.1 hypothetical protein CQA49_09195 [Helicobacter sp. MIT 00-7814]RDU51771.1 hypothetical protein CQA37_09340 [Helicobacter sp. MIT 99-10781]
MLYNDQKIAQLTQLSNELSTLLNEAKAKLEPSQISSALNSQFNTLSQNLKQNLQSQKDSAFAELKKLLEAQITQAQTNLQSQNTQQITQSLTTQNITQLLTNAKQDEITQSVTNALQAKISQKINELITSEFNQNIATSQELQDRLNQAISQTQSLTKEVLNQSCEEIINEFLDNNFEFLPFEKIASQIAESESFLRSLLGVLSVVLEKKATQPSFMSIYENAALNAYEKTLNSHKVLFVRVKNALNTSALCLQQELSHIASCIEHLKNKNFETLGLEFELELQKLRAQELKKLQNPQAIKEKTYMVV